MIENLKRLNINVPENLWNDIESYGKSIGINRTSAVIILLRQALNADKAINSLNVAAQAYEDEKNKKVTE